MPWCCICAKRCQRRCSFIPTLLQILADMPEGVRESVVAGLRGDDIDAASLLSAATAACALEVPLSLHERVIVTLVSSDGDAKSEESSGVLGAAVACRSQAACKCCRGGCGAM